MRLRFTTTRLSALAASIALGVGCLEFPDWIEGDGVPGEGEGEGAAEGEGEGGGEEAKPCGDTPAGWSCIPPAGPNGYVMGSPGVECPDWGCRDPRCAQGACPPSERGRDIDEVQHRVVTSRPFLLKRAEVTQAEWSAVMGQTPSYFADCGGDCPVEQVSWVQATDYCNALSRAEGMEECYVVDPRRSEGQNITWPRGLDCVGYRLPTEAEWEYAARAGAATAYYDGDDEAALDRAGWYVGNSGARTHPVALKEANAWGLSDMHGNVAEWVWDWYAPYAGNGEDPAGPEDGRSRALRGGAAGLPASHCRAAKRMSGSTTGGSLAVGLRVARTALPGQEHAGEGGGEGGDEGGAEGEGEGEGGEGEGEGEGGGEGEGEVGVAEGEGEGASAQLHLAQHETTVAEYRECVNRGGCTDDDLTRAHAPGGLEPNADCNWQYGGRDQHPLNCVSWYQADAYCRWADGRLPTAAEWRDEASNGGRWCYPWGVERVEHCDSLHVDPADYATCDDAVFSAEGYGQAGCGRGTTWPVCEKAGDRSANDACDLAGNVTEWTSTPMAETGEPQYMFLGGNYKSLQPLYLTADAESSQPPDDHLETVGFRCMLP